MRSLVQVSIKKNNNRRIKSGGCQTVFSREIRRPFQDTTRVKTRKVFKCGVNGSLEQHVEK